MSHVCISLLRLFELADQVSCFGRKRDVKSHDDMQHFFGGEREENLEQVEPKLERDGTLHQMDIINCYLKWDFSLAESLVGFRSV